MGGWAGHNVSEPKQMPGAWPGCNGPLHIHHTIAWDCLEKSAKDVLILAARIAYSATRFRARRSLR